ncbi:adenosylcobinamide-phosphate synthase CbiB [Polaromonas sp.]|uniref:adenosylcobinamide-phosphate synthase CbiB n=1 Tax=Polaromonas sp. TaxID=1869339 RepID=UPI001D42B01E|nr:adenosylcobinamide-phosphate synthase CbiB [Polaromonas sp.]MBT9477069.1 cobalamin biosynthesis protein CobD [Polaromonas sp.]
MSPELDALIFAAAILLAFAIDHYLGEPAARWHPVVWMGNYLGWAGRHLQRFTRQALNHASDYKAFSLGALAWSAGAAIVCVASWALQKGLLALPDALGPIPGGVLAALLLGLALKPLLAWAMLRSEVLAVENALSPAQGGSLAAGRERLSWLVSRDVTHLTETQVRESAIETLAENLNDSVVAPIFWFVLLGLPGAALYRFANTADAMWGYRGTYRGQHWEWAGKWAAWADDALSWLPARLTALLLALVTGGVSFRALRLEARKTPSPNSGWPMAAMALALGISLGKPGVYTLNAAGRAPQAADTGLAQKYALKALLALVPIALVAIDLIAFWARP